MEIDLLNMVAGVVLIYHIGNLFQFLAFLLRDQLHLRLAMFAGILLQGIFHYVEPGGPAVVPLFWKITFSITNLCMIILLFGDRFDFGIPQDLRELYRKIKVLSPGEFRKLIRISRRGAHSDEPLLTEGERPDTLHYLMKGEALMRKGKAEHRLASGVFLGEVAFLNDVPASATVTLQPGAECVSWPSAQLRALMRDDRALDIAMRGILNHDLAAKVAISIPIAPAEKNKRKKK